MNNIILQLIAGSVAGSFAVHYLVGFYLKSKLKNDDKYELYKLFDADHKANKSFKDKLCILVFLIPVYNVLVAAVEIVNVKPCYNKLLNELVTFKRKAKGEGKYHFEDDSRNEKGEYEEILEEVQKKAAEAYVNPEPVEIDDEELASEYQDFLKKEEELRESDGYVFAAGISQDMETKIG